MNAPTVILVALFLFIPASLFAQCPDLNPLDDGSGVNGTVGLPDLVISEVNPGTGGYVELFNRTDTDIVLPGIYWLCSDLQYAQVSATVPAKGYVTVMWPANFTNANDTSGEMILYKSGSFFVSTDILDYVIWGSPVSHRKNQALAVGKWSGANCGALANGAIHRLIGVKGTVAAEYDVASAPSPLDCEPPTSVRDTPPFAGAKIWSRPNPFAMNTTVEFQLDSPAAVDVSIYSIDGALVRTLAAQSFAAGIHAVHWDGTDGAGKSVASGTYLARITGGVSAATRLTLVR